MVFSLMNVFSSLALASSLSSKPAFRSAEASNLSLFRFFNFTNMPGDRRYLLFKIGFTRVLGLGGSFGSFGSPWGETFKVASLGSSLSGGFGLVALLLEILLVVELLAVESLVDGLLVGGLLIRSLGTSVGLSPNTSSMLGHSQSPASVVVLLGVELEIVGRSVVFCGLLVGFILASWSLTGLALSGLTFAVAMGAMGGKTFERNWPEILPNGSYKQTVK